MESSRSWECIVLLFSVVVEFSRVAPSDSFYSLPLPPPLLIALSLFLSLALYTYSIRPATSARRQPEFSRTKRN